MIVTGVRQEGKTKAKVEIDGQPTLTVYKGELSRYHLKEGQEIDEDVYRRLVEEILPLRAKKYCMHLLVRADKTEKELREKLKKAGYPLSVEDEAIAYVSSYGYLDDERYARQYIGNFQNREGKGQLKWKLREKGVDIQIIERVLEETAKDPKDILRPLVEKKLQGKRELSEKDHRRIYNFLIRRGFAAEDICSILREFLT